MWISCSLRFTWRLLFFEIIESPEIRNVDKKHTNIPILLKTEQKLGKNCFI